MGFGVSGFLSLECWVFATAVRLDCLPNMGALVHLMDFGFVQVFRLTLHQTPHSPVLGTAWFRQRVRYR